MPLRKTSSSDGEIVNTLNRSIKRDNGGTIVMKHLDIVGFEVHTAVVMKI
jgi:hypothetical protein